MATNTATYTDKEALRSALKAATSNWGKIRDGEQAYDAALSNNKSSEEAFRAALKAATSDKDAQLAGERVLIAHGKLTNHDVETKRRPAGWFKEKFSNSSGQLSIRLIVYIVLGGLVGFVLSNLVSAFVKWACAILSACNSDEWLWTIIPMMTVLFALIGYLIALRRVTREVSDSHTA